MEDSPIYRATFIALPPSDVLPAATTLEVAVQQLTSRLRLTATTAGLPDVAFSLRTTSRTQGIGGFTSISLMAAKPGQEFHRAPVAVEASTLDEVEIRFLDALAEYAFHQLDHVHEQEPRLFGHQQLASTLALVKEAA